MNVCQQRLLHSINSTFGPRLWIADENISAQTIAQIQADPQLYCISNRFDIIALLQARGLNAILNDFDFSECPPIDTVIYQVSKERALVQHCIVAALSQLNDGGQLILIGEKNAGIKTHGQFAEKLFGTSMSIDKQGLCYLVRLVKPPITHIEQFQDTYPKLQGVALGECHFYSKPGVYGWKKIDTGSKLLIDTVKPILRNMNTETLSVLDLGCGYGYLTLCLTDLAFRKYLATDNNAAALIAAQRNFAERELTVDLSLDDCGKHLTEKVDIIVCNPPFHHGFDHDKALIIHFVRASLALLTNKGIAFFVVNAFIPLPNVVAQESGHCELLAHESGFKVYCISRERKHLDVLDRANRQTGE